MKRNIIILIFLVCTSLVGCVKEDTPPITSLEVGDPCPDFMITMNDGSIIKTSDLRGSTTVIVFFNTECRDCQQELPVIQKIYDEVTQTNQNIRVVCISRSQGQEDIERFWKDEGLTLPYSAQTDRTVYNLFANSVIPRIYIVSPSLTIVAKWDDSPLPTAQEILSKLYEDN